MPENAKPRLFSHVSKSLAMIFSPVMPLASGEAKKKNHFVHNRRRQDGHIMLLEKGFYTRASHARIGKSTGTDDVDGNACVAEFLCHDDRHCLDTGFGGTIRELPLPRHGTGTCRDINETALSLPTFRPEHPRERRGHRSPPTTTARKLCLTLNSSVLR